VQLPLLIRYIWFWAPGECPPEMCFQLLQYLLWSQKGGQWLAAIPCNHRAQQTEPLDHESCRHTDSSDGLQQLAGGGAKWHSKSNGNGARHHHKCFSDCISTRVNVTLNIKSILLTNLLTPMTSSGFSLFMTRLTSSSPLTPSTNIYSPRIEISMTTRHSTIRARCQSWNVCQVKRKSLAKLTVTMLC